MRYSIIRRSAGVTIAFVLGHACTYTLMLIANWILGSGGFGTFYTAVLIITVGMSPTTAITLAISRHLSDLNGAGGTHRVKVITCKVLFWILGWGTLASIVGGAALAMIGTLVGVEAWHVMAIIPATVLALVATEVERVSFQSMLRFGWSSVLWIVDRACQLVFSVCGLLLFGQVWSGIFGILLGAAVTAIGFSHWFRNGVENKDRSNPQFLSIINELPSIASYSLFVLFNNLDILTAYFLLPRFALDTYAASALLPKAVVTAMFPVAQIVLPVIADQRLSKIAIGSSVVKAIVMVAALSAGAVIFFWVGLPFIQQTPVAIRGLDLDTVLILGVASIALSALRVLVVIEVVLARYIIGFSLTIGIGAFIVASASGASTINQIASMYASIAWIWLVMAAITMIFLLRTRGQMGSRSGHEIV